MACLRHTTRGALSHLEPEHLVGRSPLAALRLDEAYISMQHALIRWMGSSWELRDLGSRNGTSLDDVAIRPGQGHRLAPGSRIAFGRAEQTWELADDSAPRVMIIPLDDLDNPMFVESDILALPSAEDPRETVFRGGDGGWYLEREDRTTPLTSQLVFESAGRRYRFSCPDIPADTSTAGWPEGGADLGRARLLFRFSRDEEHVDIVVEFGAQRVELRSRVHNYLLLLLARHRLADLAQGIAAPACGWVYQEELIDALKITPDRLNIDIFRIRRQFAALGLVEAANIVERRPRTKQLRIGAAALELETI